MGSSLKVKLENPKAASSVRCVIEEAKNPPVMANGARAMGRQETVGRSHAKLYRKDLIHSVSV